MSLKYYLRNEQERTVLNKQLTKQDMKHIGLNPEWGGSNALYITVSPVDRSFSFKCIHKDPMVHKGYTLCHSVTEVLKRTWGTWFDNGLDSDGLPIGGTIYSFAGSHDHVSISFPIKASEMAHPELLKDLVYPHLDIDWGTKPQSKGTFDARELEALDGSDIRELMGQKRDEQGPMYISDAALADLESWVNMQSSQNLDKSVTYSQSIANVMGLKVSEDLTRTPMLEDDKVVCGDLSLSKEALADFESWINCDPPETDEDIPLCHF